MLSAQSSSTRLYEHIDVRTRIKTVMSRRCGGVMALQKEYYAMMGIIIIMSQTRHKRLWSSDKLCVNYVFCMDVFDHVLYAGDAMLHDFQKFMDKRGHNFATRIAR